MSLTASPFAWRIILVNAQRQSRWPRHLRRSSQQERITLVIQVTDGQVVGESVSTLFTIGPQQGPTAALVVLKNSGVNTMNYRFQEYNGSSWVDLGAQGSDYYNTLTAGEVRSFKVTSTYPQIQMVGNASGGAFIDFSITRYFNRAAGGSLPILAL